jgi:hypothetical protein
MPPQQPDRLLDLFNEAFDFGAHGFSDLRRWAAAWDVARDVAADAAKRNRPGLLPGGFLIEARLTNQASKACRFPDA